MIFFNIFLDIIKDEKVIFFCIFKKLFFEIHT